MPKFAVGDKVMRNDVVALYSEDIFPDGMEFDCIYVIRAIHTKNVPAMFNSTKFTVAELDIGEINTDLLNKIESN